MVVWVCPQSTFFERWLFGSIAKCTGWDVAQQCRMLASMPMALVPSLAPKKVREGRREKGKEDREREERKKVKKRNKKRRRKIEKTDRHSSHTHAVVPRLVSDYALLTTLCRTVSQTHRRCQVGAVSNPSAAPVP